jgi:uncharacterized protein (DUF2164 family)
MTRITILEQKLNQFKEQLQSLGEVKITLEDDRKDKLSKAINQYFEETLEQGDELEVYNSNIYFKRPQEGFNYNKEVLSLYFRNLDYQTQHASQIQTSFYSTTDNSEFELKRMVLLGKVGQIILDFGDDILAAHNQVINDTKHEINEVSKKIWDVEKQVREVEKQIHEIKKQNLLDKVSNEGVEFEVKQGQDHRSLPNIELRHKHIFHYVKGLKIVGKTASGKSADIELKTINNIWNPETQSYELGERVDVYNKVRMDNIERFLQYNSERISAS